MVRKGKALPVIYNLAWSLWEAIKTPSKKVPTCSNLSTGRTAETSGIVKLATRRL